MQPPLTAHSTTIAAPRFTEPVPINARRRGRDDYRDGSLPDGTSERRSVARYFAREREKQDLRRERDALLLRIAGDLGVGAMARQMDVSPATLSTLLARAEARLHEGPLGSGRT
jgi:hypothetical protein